MKRFHPTQKVVLKVFDQQWLACKSSPGFSRVTNRHALTPPNGSQWRPLLKYPGKSAPCRQLFSRHYWEENLGGCQAGPSPSRLVELQKADSWQEPDGRLRRRLAGQAGLEGGDGDGDEEERQQQAAGFPP